MPSRWEERDEAAAAWLLSSDEPGVRAATRQDVLREPAAESDGAVLEGPWVRALFAGQKPDGGFGGHPYAKWSGAHWRLVSMVELGVPDGEPRAVAAARTVLNWLNGTGHLKGVRVIQGLARRCGSQEGNALAVCSRLGMAAEPDAQALAEHLIGWQWPDGGWNCDPRPAARHSSVNETLPPTWGLHEFAVATGNRDAAAAADRAAAFFLEHRIFRSHRTGEVIHPRVVDLNYPPYWHYEVLQALLVLARMGCATDTRAAGAIDLLEAKRLDDGRWKADHRWWKTPTSPTYPEVVDWGKSGPNVMITLNAMRVLVASGRIGRPRSDRPPVAAR